MEMKRTKSPYPYFYRQWGGCMPFPPANCRCLDKSFVDRDSGMRWIDLGICSDPRACHSVCQRRKQYNAQEFLQEAARLSKIRDGRLE